MLLIFTKWSGISTPSTLALLNVFELQNHKQPPAAALAADVKPRFGLLIKAAQQIAGGDDHAVVETPADVGPGRPVPQADEEEHDQVGQAQRQQPTDLLSEPRLALFAEGAHCARHAQRKEHIVLHPRAERDVPPLPELCQRAGEKRPPEVLVQPDAEQQ